MYVYKHTYINTRMHVYIHACIYALYMNVCIYLYEYINICLYIYDNMCFDFYILIFFGRLKRGGSESSLPLINPASFGGKIAALAVSIRLSILSFDIDFHCYPISRLAGSLHQEVPR